MEHKAIKAVTETLTGPLGTAGHFILHKGPWPIGQVEQKSRPNPEPASSWRKVNLFISKVPFPKDYMELFLHHTKVSEGPRLRNPNHLNTKGATARSRILPCFWHPGNFIKLLSPLNLF